MNFLSPSYFLFFPVTAVGYFLLPPKARNLWLLAASWFFYLAAGPQYFAFLLGAVVLSYGGARVLEGRTAGARRGLLFLLLLLAFGTLFVLKYLGFAFATASRLLGVLGVSFTGPALDLLLPAGISFYLFGAGGYLIDVYRGHRPAERSFVHYALFLSFFPQLLSGPIPRADGLLPQLEETHHFDYGSFRSGLFRFLWGAFKKLVLADRLAVLVTTVYAAPQSFGSLQLVAAALAFSVQIYCDFSAYSDMALGSAQAMGFHLMENFQTPYFSRSIGEFWRRWHISLSSWFRDYLYIPLGGSRKGTVKKYRNVVIVFAVSGLWHGAAVTFLAWGLLNGLYQVVGGVTAPLRAKVRQWLHLGDQRRLTHVLQMLTTFLLTTAAWVFFKAGSFTNALLIFKGMFTAPPLLAPMSQMGLALPELAAAGIATLLLFCVDLAAPQGGLETKLLARPRPVRWAVALGLLLAVVVFGSYGTGYDPQAFLYFKF